MNKIMTPNMMETPNNTVELVYSNSHAKDPVNLGENEFASRQNIDDFVSKALDSFLEIQEKIKALESLSVKDQTQENMDDLLCLRNELQKKKNMYLGLVNPVQGTQDMELQNNENCSNFDQAGTSTDNSEANTKNTEELAPMKGKPIQKTKLAWKECNLCDMNFLNDKSLFIHKRAKHDGV